MTGFRKTDWHLPISFMDRGFSRFIKEAVVETQNQNAGKAKRPTQKREHRTETMIGVDLLLVDRVDGQGHTRARLVKIHRDANGSSRREDLSKEFLILDLGPEELARGVEQSQKKARIHYGLESGSTHTPPLTHRIPKKALEALKAVNVEKKPPQPRHQPRPPARTKAEKNKAQRKRRDMRRKTNNRLRRAERTIAEARELLADW